MVEALGPCDSQDDWLLVLSQEEMRESFPSRTVNSADPDVKEEAPFRPIIFNKIKKTSMMPGPPRILCGSARVEEPRSQHRFMAVTCDRHCSSPMGVHH